MKLLESTYRFASAVDKIYKDIIKPYVLKPGRPTKTVKITDYFETTIDKYAPEMVITLSFRQHPHPDNSDILAEIQEKDEDNMIIHLYLSHVRNPTKIKVFEIKTRILHELTHVFDRIRREDADINFPKKYMKTDLGYLRHPDEMNAAIHELKRVRKEYNKKYNQIKNREELTKFIDRFEHNASVAHLATAFENDHWFKKVMKRMARENLIPKAMKENLSKVDESIDLLFNAKKTQT